MRVPLAVVAGMLIAVLLAGGFSSGAHSGQGNSPGQGFNLPPSKQPCPKGTIGKWPYCIKIDKQKCPPGTIGVWPLCYTRVPTKCPKDTVRKGRKCIKVETCPSGAVGKWPKCRKPEDQGQQQQLQQQQSPPQQCAQGTVGQWPHCTTVGDPCPPGQVRKNKHCVQLAKEPPGSTITPPTLKGAAPDAIPPAIVALTANRPHRPREVLVLVLRLRPARSHCGWLRSITSLPIRGCR